MRIITSNNCLSAGDALRDIDQRGVVRSDPFILVSGDVVSNIDLKSVIKQVRLGWRRRCVASCDAMPCHAVVVRLHVSCVLCSLSLCSCVAEVLLLVHCDGRSTVCTEEKCTCVLPSRFVSWHFFYGASPFSERPPTSPPLLSPPLRRSVSPFLSQMAIPSWLTVQHKENKKADPLTLMTMCFKEVGAVSSARPILDSLVVGMSKVANQTVQECSSGIASFFYYCDLRFCCFSLVEFCFLERCRLLWVFEGGEVGSGMKETSGGLYKHPRFPALPRCEAGQVMWAGAREDATLYKRLLRASRRT